MKGQMLTKLMAIALLWSLAAIQAALGYSGGTGTSADPYQIATKADLLQLGATADDYGKCFILTADIDLSAEVFTTAPIAPDRDNDLDFQGTMFSGTFDGNGHTVSHLIIISEHSYDCLGLFGCTKETAVVKNLAVDSVAISGTGADNCGGIVGWNRGLVQDCHSSGTISGQSLVGGVVGRNYPGNITRCWSAVNVTGSGDYVGGLSGTNNTVSLITQSYATGSVTGALSYVGGLVGSSGGTISRCYASGDVSAASDGGGLVGACSGRIIDCYATGEVIVYTSVAGGLTGGVTQGGEIGRCYSTGHVFAICSAGGFAGFCATGVIYNSFWDIETSGMTQASGAAGMTTAQMQTPSTYTSAGWDLAGETANGTNDYWMMGGGYPILALGQSYSGGTGTIADPYKIATKADLLLLAATTADYDKNFILTADIDLANTAFTRAVIAPDTETTIADFQGTMFTGTFDGNGHAISNLSIAVGSSGNGCLGLFGCVGEAGVVKSLAVSISITGSGGDNCGALVGWNRGDIRNCHSSGSVSGHSQVGGLVGRNNPGSIYTSWSTAAVSGTGNYAGGLSGTNNAVSIIADCYAWGSVNASAYAGGLVGSAAGNIQRCYSTGTVSAGTGAGGLLGTSSSGAFNSSFWDTQTSGRTISGGGTGRTTAQMQTQSTFTSAGWDFTGETANGTNEYWQMPSGSYPLLTTGIVATSASGNWMARVYHPELNLGSDPAREPCLSADGLTIYFGRNVPSLGSLNIFTASRPDLDSAFGTPTMISELSHGKNVTSPWISADGLRLYYHEVMSPDERAYIRMAVRGSINEPWTIARTFTELHTAGKWDVAPTLSQDELIITYQLETGVQSDPRYICMATRSSVDAPFGPPSRVNELGSGVSSGPFISPDGLELYCTRYPIPENSGDILRATRHSTSEAFSSPLAFAPFNTVGLSEMSISFSGDMKKLCYGGTWIVSPFTEGIYTSYWYEPFKVNFVPVAKRRVGRTTFDYDCSVTLTNNTSGSLNVADFGMTGAPESVTLIDPFAHGFGTIAPGASSTSTDTLTIRVNRSQLIKSAQVTWNVTYEAAAGVQSMATGESPLELDAPVQGDINGDGIVDSADLTSLADQWLSARTSGGIVNFADFAALASQWSTSYP
jgi:hypothetical protein